MSGAPESGGKGPKKRSRHVEEEEHGGHERWLVTYADMITLLMVLFIVMFAMSSVDAKKFNVLANGLAAGFGAPAVSSNGKIAPLENSKQDAAVLPLEPGAAPTLKKDVAKASGTDAAKGAADRAAATTAAAAAVREVENLRDVQKKITKALLAKHLEDTVRFHIDERGLVVTVVTSAIVFAGDRADLLPAGREIIYAMAPALRALPNNIQVDGHTNQLKVPTRNYPSAWELSTARASAVVRSLADLGIAGKRLAAAGFAGTRPLVAPSDPRSVTMNRRVDVVVLSTLPASQRALLPMAAG